MYFKRKYIKTQIMLDLYFKYDKIAAFTVAKLLYR